MEKNENGYSAYNFGNRSGLNCRGERKETKSESNAKNSYTDSGEDKKIDIGTKNSDDTTAESLENGECSKKQLAMVYSPYQCFRMIYSPMSALEHGTLFEELYKPLMEDCKNG